MIGVSVSDNGAINALPGINEEISRLAKETVVGELE
jgi:hypothetical protein